MSREEPKQLLVEHFGLSFGMHQLLLPRFPSSSVHPTHLLPAGMEITSYNHHCEGSFLPSVFDPQTKTTGFLNRAFVLIQSMLARCWQTWDLARRANLALRIVDCITTLARFVASKLEAAKSTKAREGANVMLIIGCDFHPGFQQVAIFDKRTGEYEEKRLAHREEAEQFYRSGRMAQGSQLFTSCQPHCGSPAGILGRCYRDSSILVLICSIPAFSQKVGSVLPVGTVIPSVTCDANPQQTYALYLPSHISNERKWPILYVFDPVARGPLAVETVRAAAEKYGYIVAASNNSHNGPLGGNTEAAQAIWQDTQIKLPVDEKRRYAAGMSGGARVATGIALHCNGCIAGVVANAAGFPGVSLPPADMKFVYFGTVGNADFNYPEFFRLRKKLDEVHARYKIRVFEGEHGWAPPEVWLETLNWLDLQAMATGALPRDGPRIQQSLKDAMARAEQLQAGGDSLEAAREYQSVIRDFDQLSDVTAAREKLAVLVKEKAYKNAEREEADAVSEQAHLSSEISSQISAIPNGLDAVAYLELRSRMAELKKKADPAAGHNDRESLVALRTRQQVVAEAFEDGQASADLKQYDDALQYFEVAAAGARFPGWSLYQRARVYALKGDGKGVLASLKSAVAAGFNDAARLDADEFKAYRDQPQFQEMVAEIKQKEKALTTQ